MNEIITRSEAQILLDGAKRAGEQDRVRFWTEFLANQAKGHPYKIGDKLKASGGKYKNENRN